MAAGNQGQDFRGIKLARTGDVLPTVGYGCWKVPKNRAAEAVVEAIEAGYRHLDCACDYGNEKEVGEGIKAAIDRGLVTREELWVTSKLWCTYVRPEHVEAACRKSLEDLGLDYVDLYLVHFPFIALQFVPFDKRYPPEWIHDPEVAKPKIELDKVPFHQTWAAMESLVDKGLVKNLGLCNMASGPLRDVLSYARIAPQVLQVELHPFLVQPKLLQFCAQEKIAVTGFSPLGAGSYVELGGSKPEDSVLRSPVVNAIAERLGKSAAQVVLRWGVQRGTAVIPKTSRKERLPENIGLFDFELTEEDMEAINGLDQHRRFNDPGVFCSFMGQFTPVYD